MKDIREYFIRYPNLKTLTDEEIAMYGKTIAVISNGGQWLALPENEQQYYIDKCKWNKETYRRRTMEWRIFRYLSEVTHEMYRRNLPDIYPIKPTLEVVRKVRSGEIDWETFRWYKLALEAVDTME